MCFISTFVYIFDRFENIETKKGSRQIRIYYKTKGFLHLEKVADGVPSWALITSYPEEYIVLGRVYDKEAISKKFQLDDTSVNVIYMGMGGVGKTLRFSHYVLCILLLVFSNISIIFFVKNYII